MQGLRCESHELQQGPVQSPAHGSGQPPVSIQSSPAEKDLGVLVDENLDISRHCALTGQKANHILGCIKSSMDGRSREVIPLLHSGETSSGVLHSALEPSAQERHGAVGAGPEKATKMIRGLEHLCCEERLRKLGLFSLKKRRLQETLLRHFST